MTESITHFSEISYGESKAEGIFIDAIDPETGMVVRINQDQADMILIGDEEELEFQGMKFTAQIPWQGVYAVVITDEDGGVYHLEVAILEELSNK